MTSLLRADFRRVLKDKLLIVMGILAVVFALITPLMYALMFSGMDGFEKDELVRMFAVSGKTQFFASFSIGNNFGLIAPVLLAIVLCKDFSFGTIRNKIIAGKSRTQIFLSLFVTCSVVFVVMMLLHAFIALGVTSLLFGYQDDPFTSADFWYFLESLGFAILTLLFVSAMLSWLCATMKNVGLVIVLYVAASFVLVMAGGIIDIIVPIMEATGGEESTIAVLRFVNRINVGYSVARIGTGSSYTLEDALYLAVPAVVSIGGFLGLGLLKFNKKDLK